MQLLEVEVKIAGPNACPHLQLRRPEALLLGFDSSLRLLAGSSPWQTQAHLDRRSTTPLRHAIQDQGEAQTQRLVFPHPLRNTQALASTHDGAGLLWPCPDCIRRTRQLDLERIGRAAEPSNLVTRTITGVFAAGAPLGTLLLPLYPPPPQPATFASPC